MSFARIAFVTTFLIGLAAPVQAKWHPKPHRVTEVPVSVTDAWIRLAPPGANVMAAYMLVVNLSNKGLKLTGVTSPSFEEVQMHVSEVKDGMTLMREVPGFTLGPGAHLVFKPGGSHLMLMSPKRVLKEGDIVPLVLHFDKAGIRSLQVRVLPKGITGESLQHP